MRPPTVRTGQTIDLASHALTRAYGLKGEGVVTVAAPTLVIVRTHAGYLHCPIPLDFAPKA